jgi:NADPH:quinone reductase
MPSVTMNAMMVDSAGADFRLQSVSKPVPGPDEVLVRIHGSGVNPLDIKIRAGQADHARQPLPAIVGIDMAGIVETVGADVSRFRPGDAVFGMTGGVGGVQGSLADYASVDADLLALKPANLSMRQAAALPLAVITAWEGLVDRAAMQSGQKVLIQGGAGGVGHVAVQIAHAFGAHAFATVSAGDFDYVAGLGAVPIGRDLPLDRQIAQYADGRGFDLVYDTVGGPVLDASFNLVRRFGHVVSALGWGTHPLAPLSLKAASYSGVFTLLPLLTGEGRAHHGEILEHAATLVEGGRLVPRLDPRRFALADAGEAHAALASGSARGKIVIELI